MNSILSAVVVATLTLAAIEAGADGTPGERQVALTIESKTLAEALDQWAQQSGFQIFVQNWDIAKTFAAPMLKGTFEAQDALEQLLAGTPLTYVWLNDHAVAIRMQVRTVTSQTVEDGSTSSVLPPLRLAKLGDAGDRSQAVAQVLLPGPSKDSARSPGERVPRFDDLEEIIVTGSHIRGVTPASPVQSFDRKIIDRSGYATVNQFLSTVPGNFGGDINENSAAGLAAPGASFTNGSGVNLRGLGSDSTLVLLNGRRLAPAGFGEFVDVSMIPVSAIDRIDILSDGASAVYGADAVGGVVNIVLRDDYEGAETRLRYGSVTEGSSAEYQAAQTLGASWGSGHVMASYEYYERDHLNSSERDYTQDAPDPLYLLPQQTRRTIFAALSQDVGEGAKLFAEGNASKRNFEISSSDNLNAVATLQTGEVSQYGITLGLDVPLAATWQSQIVGSYNRSKSSSENFFLPGRAPFAAVENQFETSNFDVGADGEIVQLPGGALRLAIGGQYRRELYEPKRTIAYRADRDITAAFAEFSVPLVGRGNRRGGVERLEVSVAGRYEDYSDFGTSTNPKFGVVWSPLEAFSVRGTYGKSFRAPSFDELDETGNGIIIIPLPDPVLGGATPTLVVVGNNAQLEPERATTWTLGVDYKPRDGLSTHLTFFSINFKDRVGVPLGLSGLGGVLGEIDSLAPFAFRNPSLAVLQTYASDPRFVNPFQIELADVGALVDARSVNLAATRTEGVDFIVSYSNDTKLGRFDHSLSGEYLTGFERRLLPVSPFDSVVNTPFNPVRLRVRGDISWSLEHFGMTLGVNHTGRYDDDRVTPARDVTSWTTVDTNVRYSSGEDGSWLSGVEVVFSVINILDRDPPFVRDAINSLNYDGANANALGRFASLQVMKKW